MPSRFAASYLEYAGNITNAPDSFHRFAAVTACCAALGNRVWVSADWGNVYPAPWVCFVGPSRVHKSYSVTLVEQLLAEALPDIELPSLFSAEALIEQLARQPAGFMGWGEMALSFANLTQTYNAMVVGLLLEIWDSKPRIKRTTKADGPVTIERPAVTILAAGKTVWFRNEFRPERIGGVGGGFIGRWMYVMENSNKGYRSSFANQRNGKAAGQPQIRAGLVAHLRSLQQVRGEIRMTSEALDVYDTWARRLEEWDDDRDPAEFSKRAESNVLKLAIGIQACRGPDDMKTLHPKAVEQAITLWEQSFKSGRQLVEEMQGTSRDEAELDTLREVLAKASGQITQREWLRGTRMQSDHFQRCVKTLLQTGEAALVPQERKEGQRGPLPVVYQSPSH